VVVLAKGLAAGYAPLGAALMPARLVEELAATTGFVVSHSYDANPIACAAGAAVLDEIVERDLMGCAERAGRRLRAGLDAIAQRSPLTGEVRGRGLLLAMELVADKGTLARFPADIDPGSVVLRHELPVATEPQVAFADFRADPEGHPLITPTGKIEIFSETIGSYRYPDCPGHPVWREPDEWLGSPAARRFGLQLVANQPRSRLHSQLDVGAHSQSVKIAGREPVRLHPADAAARCLRDGDLVRIFNDRGACLAGLAVDEAVRPGPGQPGLCRHGNPNVLTADRPSSTLSQGCTGQLALVEIEPYRGIPPELSVTRPPATA
jgi:hypothetical protein